MILNNIHLCTFLFFKRSNLFQAKASRTTFWVSAYMYLNVDVGRGGSDFDYSGCDFSAYERGAQAQTSKAATTIDSRFH